jgi:Rrf2 family protein
MIQISKRVEYALRAVIYLASLPADRVESFRDIAEQQKVPKDFLAKILRSLVDAGVLRSVRGSAGGFALQMDPGQISFLDVIVATEGPIALNDCCAAGEGCARMGSCSMETVWRRAERAMLEVFSHTYISDVMPKPPGQGGSAVVSERSTVSWVG